MTDEFTHWRKSSRCGGGECIEVGTPVGGRVGVRDTKLERSPVLAFSADTWAAFTAALKAP